MPLLPTSRETMWPSIDSLCGLSEHQAEETAKALARPIGILAGRPGTGKTFTIAAISKQLSPTQTVMCAFPGKAAARMKESIVAAGGSPLIRASTIHSLLQAQPRRNGWRFAYNEHLPLPYQYYFVDEASMLDNWLLAQFLRALPPNAHVLFVGDTNQLPPIGIGAPLRDMIRGGVPHGHLTAIRRNSGRIVRACHSMIEHMLYQPGTVLDYESGENLIHCQLDSAAQIKTAVLCYVEKIAATTQLSDWQIIVPLNTKSIVSRRALNVAIQQLLRPNCKPGVIGIGDKIICLSNGLSQVVDCNGLSISSSSASAIRSIVDANAGQYYITNGEQAIVTDESRNSYTATVISTGLRIRIMKNQCVAGDQDAEDVDNEAKRWDLAYAISAHKSQGSEWPHVLVVIDPSPGAQMLYTREWLYTAISRGKASVQTVGPFAIADAMCKRSSLALRRTMLAEAIAAKLFG